MKKNTLIFTFCFFVLLRLDAQNSWVDKMDALHANFYEIQKDFNESMRDADVKEENNEIKESGDEIFKRWEEFVAPRVYPSGDVSMLNYTSVNYKKFLRDYKNNTVSRTTANASWKALGPFGGIGGQQRSGRLNYFTFHPTDKNIIWAGSPGGGLWKTTDAGVNWTTSTDDLDVMGSSDLAIDPTNPLIMYLATGDADGKNCRSVGVLKSIDGGNTWNDTGFKPALDENIYIYRIIINPQNTNIILAATTVGIQRTSDGGVSWTLVDNAISDDLEFKPGDANIVYSGGKSFKLSIDGGVTWKQISSITSAGIQRIAVAVTKADPTIVYAIAAYDKTSTTNKYGFEGFYRSTDSGNNFTKMATSPNLLGWAAAGNDTGGQGFYTLSLGASPIKKDEVIVGGVNTWTSSDGGKTWRINSHWSGSGAVFVHADHHKTDYDNSGNLYSANDGTLFRTPAGSLTSWREISGKMNISQIYKIGTSSLTANKWVTGHQDNGSALFSGTYSAVYGGDGMDCFIDRTSDNNVFVSYVYGEFKKSTNGGASVAPCTSGLSGKGDWLSPWKQDPVSSQRLYAGYTAMYVSNNLAGSWSSLGNPGGDATKFITEFAISKSNNKVLYVLKSTGVYKTINGGTSWTDITGNLPISATLPNACLPTFVTINPKDEKMAWVTFSGYAAGNKVFVTKDGGSNWINITGNLPNIPANCSVYQDVATSRLFVGMDVGVYYSEKNSTDWTLYNTSLPNTPVRDMEISPAAPDKIRAATFGRGVWEVDISSIITSADQVKAEKILFNIYPNPASTNLNINIHLADKSDIAVDVIDMLGRTILKVSEEKNVAQGLYIQSVNTSLLSNGVYSVRVVANGKASVKLLNVIHD
ncbi:MAG: T9SS type A sorting domain-containing protein [Bacteroidia bacterium]